MVAKWSHGITVALADKGVIERSKSEIYIYGFEILISTLLNALIIITIAILTNTFLLSLAFLASFGTLRLYTGGFHASTHLRCFVLFSVT